MSDKQETVADIIAEMKREAAQIFPALPIAVLQLAARIEAACLREHEALEFIAHYCDDIYRMDDSCCADGYILADKAKEALGIKEDSNG